MPTHAYLCLPSILAGTLDPMATGLLIVCVGKGTKAVDAFMAMTKEVRGAPLLPALLLPGPPRSERDSTAPDRFPAGAVVAPLRNEAARMADWLCHPPPCPAAVQRHAAAG